MAISNLATSTQQVPGEDWYGMSKLKHVIESQQFTQPLLTELFQRSRGMERVVARGGTLEYQNKILASLFYQPSTRTRFSFEAAMYRLGGKVLSTEQAGVFSSEIAGEQVEDSIRIIANYSDVIVVRHPQVGGAQRAAQVSTVPIINAGDGEGGQHPTQALLDLYTIYRERPAGGTQRGHCRRIGPGANGQIIGLSPRQIRESENLFRGADGTPDEARHSGISR